MRYFTFFLIIFVFLFFCKIYGAQNKIEWIPIEEDDSGNKYYINLNSIESYSDSSIKNGVKILARIIFSEKTRNILKSKETEFSTSNIQRIDFYSIINCNEKKLGLFSLTLYDKDENVLLQETLNKPKFKKEFFKAEYIINFVCEQIKTEKEWVYIGKDASENKLYVNLKSIKSYSSYFSLFIKNGAKVWTKTIYSEKGKKEEITKKKERKLPVYYNIYETLDYWIIDCDKKKIGNISVIDYDKTGKVLNSVHIPEVLAELDPVVPRSIGEDIVEFVCELIKL